jgi:hypothetical protein
MAGRGFLLFAASVIAVLAFSGAASAQSLAANQTYLNAAARYAQCKTNFTVAYAGGAVFVVPKLSGIGQYSAVIESETSQLYSLAAAGNVSSFGSYLSGTYDPELNAIAKNFSAQIKAANLTKNQTAQLRLLYNRIYGVYLSCRMGPIMATALDKLAMFNQSIASYQNETSTLSQQGISTGGLTLLLQNAKAQIVVPLATAVAQAVNASPISAALAQYCLFDGCKNGTNFHLAAHFELQKLTAELGYLGANKSVSSSSLASAQSDLNSAASVLQAVGTAAYAGGQSSTIFSNLTAATKAMQQARQQQALASARQRAANVIGSYQNAIGSDRAKIAQLAANGIQTAGLNQTLQNATSQVILPLQNALNSSANLTQLNAAFKGLCLENGCANGTNFHLSDKLTVGVAQAELANLANKASAYGNVVTVNSTALSKAQAYLNNASAIIGSAGGAQISNALAGKLKAYSGNFTAAVKNAYIVTKNAAATVRSAVVKPTAAQTGANSASGATAGGGKVPIATNGTRIPTGPVTVKPNATAGPVTVRKNGTSVTVNPTAKNATTVPPKPSGTGAAVNITR